MSIHANPVYAQIAATTEQWKQNYTEAMRCRDFEEWLSIGIETLEHLIRFDEGWRADVLSGELVYDPNQDELITKVLELWLDAARNVESQIAPFERRFGHVEHAARFRECFRMAQSMLTPDELYFTSEKLVAARDQAIDDHRRGATDDLDDDA